MAGPERIAFCGLGIMGAPMATQLLRAGFEVAVYTRTREKAERFAAEHGARAAATPAEAAADADAFVSIVPDSPEVEQVLFGADGAAAALPHDALVIDMSTIAPSDSRAIAERLAPRAFVEAPVSGSRPKAEDGTLTIMAGGAPEDFERARPLFEAMGERIVHVGPVGHGQMAKLLTNMMGAVNAAALAEAVRTAKAAGLDRDAFLEVAGGSAGASAMLTLKDLRYCIVEASALGIELQLAGLAERLYSIAVAAGHGESDFAAIYTAR